MSFSSCPFTFSRPFRAVRKFFQSRSEAEKLPGLDKKNFFAYQSRCKGTFLLYTGKI